MRKQLLEDPRWSALAIGLFLITSWEIAARSSIPLTFLVSKPSDIVNALWLMAISGQLAVDVAVTTAEAVIGTILGTVVGSALGLGLWLSKRVARIAAPFVLIAANFPIFALAPVAIIWLGIGLAMKVFLAAFATFFVSLHLAHAGAQRAMDRFSGVFDGFRARRTDTYIKIIVPGAIEAVFESMRVNVGLGILGAFIGEFIVSDDGLGRSIIRASGLYQIDNVFASAVCIVAVAGLLDRLAYGIQQERLLIARFVGVPVALRRKTQRMAERLESLPDAPHI